MSPRATLIEFDSREAMADRLADVIEAQLGRAVAVDGEAAIAVSGGSTPALLHQVLSERSLDWGRVTATLVDERWVAPGEKGSNETFVNETLAIGKAANIKVEGLWRDAPTPKDAEFLVDEELSAHWRAPDVLLLGMGPDGHTASWFPHADGLDQALTKDGKVCAVSAIRSEVTGDLTDRMTMTLSAVASAKLICLLMAGDEKKATFEAVMGGEDENEMPVRAILRARPDMWVTWAP